MGKIDNLKMAKGLKNFFIDVGANLVTEIPDSVLNMDLSFRGDREHFNFRNVEEE